MKFEAPTARYLVNTLMRQQFLNIGYLHITSGSVRLERPDYLHTMTVHHFPSMVAGLHPNPGYALKGLLYDAAIGRDPDQIGNATSQIQSYIGYMEEYGRFMG